jgi:hypothetical protein
VTTPNPSPRTAGFNSPFYRHLALVFFLLLFLSSVLSGFVNASGPEKHEVPYALIFGTVWGPDNQPVYGAKVAVRRSEDKKARWHLVSDHNGEFAQRVPAGRADYVVWVESVPWKRIKSSKTKDLAAASAVKVHIENDERSDIGLHLTE